MKNKEQILSRLTAIGEPFKIGKNIVCQYKCTCGNIKTLRRRSVDSGHTKSCGCYSKEIRGKYGGRPRTELSTTRFGRLTILDGPFLDNGELKYICECDCGTIKTLSKGSLTSGSSSSCGCLRKESTGNRARTHGKTNTLAYVSWLGIIKRCYNPNEPAYKNYGGRGITVCEEWKNSFENFLHDMGPRPLGISIERIDNNGNYNKNNCVWASRKTQNRNSRNNNLVTYNSSTKPVSAWCELLGIPYKRTIQRISSYGMSPEKAFQPQTLKSGPKKKTGG
jgi:hypothetical protein